MWRRTPGQCAPDRRHRNGRPRLRCDRHRGGAAYSTRQKGRDIMKDSRQGLTITRRGALAGALGTAALAASGPALAQAGGRKPNVLYIMADDLGFADLSCYGRRDYATPVLD